MPGVRKREPLSQSHPALVAQWHADNDKSPDAITAGSGYMARWQCPAHENHVWSAKVYSRVAGNGCPYCSGAKVLAGFNDALTTHPFLAELRHPGNPIDLESVSYHSNIRVPWKCAQGHEWIASIATMAGNGGRCRTCPEPETEHVAAVAHLAALWHLDNADDPATVSVHSSVTYRWACPHGHTWQAITRRVAAGEGCPYCTPRRKLLPGFNDLATLRPDLAAQWSPDNEKEPHEFTAGSPFRTAWQCPENSEHRYTAEIKARAKGNGCPYCSGHSFIEGEGDLASLHPDIAALWDPENIDPASTVAPASNRKVGWVCAHGHRWESKVQVVVNSRGRCPTCAGSTISAGFNDLATLRPDLVAQWAASNTADPHTIGLRSRVVAAWTCTEGHEWHCPVWERADGATCRVCSGNEVCVGFNDLASLDPDLAAQWHSSNDRSPEEVTRGSHYEAMWLCPNCDCDWKAKVAERALSGQGCPFCAGKRVKVGFNDLATLRPDIAAEWSPANFLTPTDVTVGSSRRIEWLCSKGHTWSAVVAGRTRGRGCPHCVAPTWVSGGERAMAEFVAEIVPELLTQTSVRSIAGVAEFDVYVPDKAIAFEYNGLYWHSEANGKDHKFHQQKTQAAAAVGIRLVHIWEDDWLFRRPIVEHQIRSILGVDARPRVGARTCTTAGLTWAVAKKFLDDNHIQGAVSGTFHDGLVGPDGQVIAVLTTTRTGTCYRIDRYATSCKVPGGFGKLLSLLRSRVAATGGGLIVTFSDTSWSNGDLYRNTGFTCETQIPPDYSYIVGPERIHKFNYRRGRFQHDPALTFDPALTEREMAVENGLHRIWDCGKRRWVMQVEAA